MGMGQFHYARHRTLAAHRAHGSPDLQLVDAIGSAGTTVQTLGSDLQPSANAARLRHAHTAWWTDALDHHKHPHQTGQDPRGAGQFGRIPESIEINCKAVDDAQRLLQMLNRAFDKFKLPNTDRSKLLACQTRQTWDLTKYPPAKRFKSQSSVLRIQFAV